MLQMLDITKPVKEIILDKFNAKAGLSIDYDHIVLGAITVITEPGSKENTSIQLVPTLLAPHLNTFTLRYNRMELMEIFSAPHLFVPSNGFTTLYELLDDINQSVGLNLTVDDVVDAPIVVAADTKVNIQAKTTSVLYQGFVELMLNTKLNVPSTTVESSNTIFVVNVNNSGLDYVSSHAFDGYKSTAFKYLRNVNLVVQSDIDRIFSCEGDILVLAGTFQFVAPLLPFITPSTTYHTLTMTRDGTLLSARVEVTLLNIVTPVNIAVDGINKTYYVADSLNVNGDPKQSYRLFQNGTIDPTFDNTDIVDGVVKLVPVQNGFYAISFTNPNTYTVNKHLLDASLDPAFTTVLIETTSITTAIDAVCTLDEFGEEVLHVYLSNYNNDVTNAPAITATTIEGDFSAVTTDFYSPILSIHDHGELVKISSTLSKFNSNNPFQNSLVTNTLVKTLRGNVALYCLTDFGMLNYYTVAPLIFGEDKEYSIQTSPIDKTLNASSPPKVYQSLNGHETYVIVSYINSNTGNQCTGVISFDIEHSLNGLVVQETAGLVQITDLAILR